MDRRQFGRVFLALFGARAVAEVADGTASGLLLEDARTNVCVIVPDTKGGYLIPQEFASASWWPPGVITDEMLDDVVVEGRYGNA